MWHFRKLIFVCSNNLLLFHEFHCQLFESLFEIRFVTFYECMSVNSSPCMWSTVHFEMFQLMNICSTAAFCFNVLNSLSSSFPLSLLFQSCCVACLCRRGEYQYFYILLNLMTLGQIFLLFFLNHIFLSVAWQLNSTAVPAVFWNRHDFVSSYT